MLEIRNLHVKYGGIHALKGISLNVEEKRIVSLLGANGAGKSTTVRAVSGIVSISSGEITFQGSPISRTPAHAIQRLGLVHIPEGRKIFANLTVRENLIMGAYNNNHKADVAKSMGTVVDAFPVLASRIEQLGGTLSGGEQQ
ncbi:MAG: ATP-binding cassette domain-containing protein, partial [Desulfomonile tiedjei]|nr:ATP-binding cassette domain-containing protein [Desulfomonile tiedjei]